MSDHVVLSDRDSDGMAKESLHLYQSAWMAHWMQRSCKDESQGLDPLSLHSPYREEGDSKQLGPEIPSNISKSAKGIREFSESKTVNTVNESLQLGSKKFGKERLESQPFQHDVGSSSEIVTQRYNSGKSPGHSFIWQQEELNQPSRLVTTKQLWTNTKLQSYSTSLVHEKKICNPLDFRRSGTSSSRQNNVPLLLHDPSASNNRLPVFVGKQSKDLQNHYGTRSFPNWSIPLDAAKSETLFHEFFSVPRIPGSLADGEKMGICTAVNSSEEISGRPPMFSRTKHHFTITKETGASMSSGGEMFRDLTLSANIKGKMLNNFPSPSPRFGLRVPHGVKLQPLGSSSDSDGKENFGNVKTSTVCLRNESSAETDTMDPDVFQKDHFSGVVSSSTNEIKNGGQVSSTSQAALTPFTEETGGRLPNTELPDINEEIPAVPDVARSMDDGETSTSRTQSLDVDHLLSHVELPSNSKSIAFPGAQVESEPGIRWVKRLKLSASGTFAHGAKSSKMEEASSHEKVNNVFNKIMRCSMTGSEPAMGKSPGREPMALGQTAVLSRNGESSSSESLRKTQDVTPSNPWIRRWCHHRDVSSTQNHEALVVCEPQSSNAALDEFRKKQFPSIAAMALVGKALNSFQPCEFRKRGAYIVWNT